MAIEVPGGDAGLVLRWSSASAKGAILAVEEEIGCADRASPGHCLGLIAQGRIRIGQSAWHQAVLRVGLSLMPTIAPGESFGQR
jgi:hypothetical protein